jgi:MoaA/NifB/PqqE/SkfB family radical SAM enzyme
MPQQVRLEASSFCQLRCPSCPTTTGHIHPTVGSGFLALDNFKDFIDKNPQLKKIELSNYGEVFLNSQLVDILEYAYRKNVEISIGGGANLNHAGRAALEAIVKFRVEILTCSIDGASPGTYRVYRVRGDFNAVVRNIETINAFKKQYSSDLPQLVWQFIVFGHNEHEIPAARAMAAKLGMDFRTKLMWDSSSPIHDRGYVLKETNHGVTTREEYEQVFGKKYLAEICYQLWDFPQINWDGKLLGCCRNFWGDFGGNAFSDGLVVSINGAKISYAREMLKGRRAPRADIPCTTCEMYQAMQKSGKFISDR